MSVTAFTTALLLTTTALPVDSMSAPAEQVAELATAAQDETPGSRPTGQDDAAITGETPAAPPVAGQEDVAPVQPESVAPEGTPAAPQAAVPSTDAQPAPQEADAEENEIIVTARPRFVPGDPFLAINAQSFAVIQSVDKAFVGPVALKYKDTVPRPIRTGMRNFLNNLQEPVVFLNYLLQFKVGKAAETAGRFAINTTLGLGGLFDSAKKHPFNLPRRPNGFAYTLGFYGVKPGPFFFLPLIGPTTLRDVFGRLIDLSVLPFAVGKPFSEPLYAIPTTIVRLIDERAENDEELRALNEGSSDPYTANKENYLQRRQAEIDALRGRSSPSQGGAGAPPVSSIGEMTPQSVKPADNGTPPVVTTLPEVPVFEGLSPDRIKSIRVPEGAAQSDPARGDQATPELQPQP